MTNFTLCRIRTPRCFRTNESANCHVERSRDISHFSERSEERPGYEVSDTVLRADARFLGGTSLPRPIISATAGCGTRQARPSDNKFSYEASLRRRLTSAHLGQLIKWSLTIPVACIKA